MNIEFKEIDTEGLETLDVISSAKNFNHWMFETIKPFCKGDILEIGSGIGNISNFFLNEGFNISLSDIRENYCSFLKEGFSSHKNLKQIIKLDIVHPDFDLLYKDFIGTFDTIFALNVIEHIEDDVQAITNCKKLLKADGKLIILVPAYQWLYNKFDKELFHFRRYNLKSLSGIIQKGKLKVIHKQHFNLAGIPGWFISGKIQSNKIIPKGQMKLFDRLVPLFKIADKLVFNKIGLSAICIGKKE